MCAEAARSRQRVEAMRYVVLREAQNLYFQ